MRNDNKSVKNGLRRRESAAGDAAPEVNAELLAIPRLGRVRAEALAAAGITSLAELAAMPEETLAAVKWVGVGNARRIKQWLVENPLNGGTADGSSTPAPVKSARRKPAAPAKRSVSPSVAPAPTPTKPAKRSAASSAVPTTPTTPPARRTRASKKTITIEVTSDAPEIPTEVVAHVDDAVVDVADFAILDDSLQEDRGQIGSAVMRLKDAIPKKSREKKLGRQLDKVAQSVSEIPDLEALHADEKQAAAKALDRIAKLLSEAVESGKLSAKKQEIVAADLKKFRKRLEKALGG